MPRVPAAMSGVYANQPAPAATPSAGGRRSQAYGNTILRARTRTRSPMDYLMMNQPSTAPYSPPASGNVPASNAEWEDYLRRQRGLTTQLPGGGSLTRMLYIPRPEGPVPPQYQDQVGGPPELHLQRLAQQMSAGDSLEDLRGRVSRLQQQNASGSSGVFDAIRDEVAMGGDQAYSPGTLARFARAEAAGQQDFADQQALQAGPPMSNAGRTPTPMETILARTAKARVGRREVPGSFVGGGGHHRGQATGMGPGGILYGVPQYGATLPRKGPSGMSKELADARAAYRQYERARMNGQEAGVQPPTPEQQALLRDNDATPSAANVRAGSVLGPGGIGPAHQQALDLAKQRYAAQRGRLGTSDPTAPQGAEEALVEGGDEIPSPRELVRMRGIAKGQARQQRLLNRNRGPSREDMMVNYLMRRGGPQAVSNFMLGRERNQILRQQYGGLDDLRQSEARRNEAAAQRDEFLATDEGQARALAVSQGIPIEDARKQIGMTGGVANGMLDPRTGEGSDAATRMTDFMQRAMDAGLAGASLMEAAREEGFTRGELQSFLKKQSRTPLLDYFMFGPAGNQAKAAERAGYLALLHTL